MKISTGQEYAAKIINTKKLSARGEYTSCEGGLCPQEKLLSNYMLLLC